MDFSVFKDATIEDLLENPTKFGLPTLEQFARNKDKWKIDPDQTLKAIDAGSKNLERHVSKHVYFVLGHKCDSLEKAEQVAQDFGVNIRDLDVRPEVVELGAGKCNIHVKFSLKAKEELNGPESTPATN